MDGSSVFLVDGKLKGRSYFILLNATKYTTKWDKNFLKSKTEQVIWDRVEDYKDESELHFLTFLPTSRQ